MSSSAELPAHLTVKGKHLEVVRPDKNRGKDIDKEKVNNTVAKEALTGPRFTSDINVVDENTVDLASLNNTEKFLHLAGFTVGIIIISTPDDWTSSIVCQ